MPTSSSLKLPTLVRRLQAKSPFWTHPDCPFHAHLKAGHPQVMLVAGNNAEGKSVFVETLRIHMTRDKGDSIQVSIRERTLGGVRQSSMFGCEERLSTGAASLGVIERQFKKLGERSEGGTKMLLVLDEPDLGLALNYASALGTWIVQQFEQLKREHVALAVVTHNKDVARGILTELGTAPTFVYLGKDGLTLEQWLAPEPQRSVKELKALRETGRRNMNKMAAVLTQLDKVEQA